MGNSVISRIIPESELHSKHGSGVNGAQFEEPADILELISYQPGAVISKSLINGACGNVTLFAFDQGQGLSEHTSPFSVLVQILEGTAEIFVSGKPMKATKGQILTLPANQPHSLNAVSRFKMLLTMMQSI